MEFSLSSAELMHTLKVNTTLFLFLEQIYRGNWWTLEDVLELSRAAVAALICPGNGIPRSVSEACRLFEFVVTPSAGNIFLRNSS